MLEKRICDFPSPVELIPLMPRFAFEEVLAFNCEWDTRENNSVATFFLSSLNGQ